MKRSTIGRITILVIVLVAVWQTFRYRIYIEAWLWHRPNGETITVGNYVIPVPNNWYVDNEGDRRYLLFRLDTDRRVPLTTKMQHSAILLFIERPLSDQDIRRLQSLEDELAKKRGAQSVSERAFSIGDDTIHCVGGDKAPGVGIFDIDPVS